MTVMRRRDLLLRGVTYYWRTHLTVVVGVATAVAVLAGALLVGDSVRGSLRDLRAERLGRADLVVLADAFFREQLADDIASQPRFETDFSTMTPLILVQGLITEQESGRRAGQVLVYGVDDRFWRFHGVDEIDGPDGRDVLISPALAAQIGASAGDAVVVRLQRPSDAPLESLHGRRDDLGSAVRLRVRAVVPRASLGEFSLAPQQGDVRAVFLPLTLLQDELGTWRRVNALLAAAHQDLSAFDNGVAELEQLVREQVTLDDVGLFVSPIEDRRILVVGSTSGLLDVGDTEAIAEAAADADLPDQSVMTYLANSMRVAGREIPYSLVTAIDLEVVAPGLDVGRSGDTPPPLVLNQWAADDLESQPGDRVTLEYFVWEASGGLVTQTADFTVAGIVPIDAGDADMAPVYQGLTDADSLVDWDPPFAIDLSRIRSVDEEYWEQYRTTPKAFVPLDVGQDLWGSPYGEVTSVRLTPPMGEPVAVAAEAFRARLRATIDPLGLGMAVRDVRAEGLAAASGTTDFGAYFVYFSFFLVVSALLLAALFFKLGVEQRMREVGLLRAVGFSASMVRRLFVGEALAVSVVGQRARRRRCVGLCVADDCRSPVVVGWSGWHHGDQPARVPRLARGRSGWGSRCGRGRHLVDTPIARRRDGPEPACGAPDPPDEHSRLCTRRREGPSGRAGVVRCRRSAAHVRRGRMDGSSRRILRGRVSLACRMLDGVFAAAPAAAERLDRWTWLAVGRATRFAVRDLSTGSHGPVDCRDCQRDLCVDLGRCLPSRRGVGGRRHAHGPGRVRPMGRYGGADCSRS